MKEKYKKILPTIEYLSDPVILALAWKKSHQYIRSHNWYADTLELDASAINLEQNLHKWASEISTGTYRASPLRVVPAPKNDLWVFSKVKSGDWLWQPSKKIGFINGKREKKSLCEPLRPLAHLTIKDQTVATAIMMCLANAIETLQGSTEAIETSSFGNRLFCKWENSEADFSWGSSNTYSKYYKDYQIFLERTSKWGRGNESNAGQVFYEVQLDMSAFYDSIDRTILVKQLKKYSAQYYNLPNEEAKKFWHFVEQCFSSWKWDDADEIYNECMKKPFANNGLPQGLVASGFFANVYLIDFDKKCKELINRSHGNFIVHGYCRYVDDLRLVISADSRAELYKIEKSVNRLISKIERLLPQSGGLSFNRGKTKVIQLDGSEGEVSQKMKQLEQAASGPMDLESLKSIEFGLDSLFIQAENQLEIAGAPAIKNCTAPLANIRNYKLDIREDTILRFAANRWTKNFIYERKITSKKEKASLDAKQESVARRFIFSWSRNPALVLLLKKGLQLYPSAELLDIVWTSLTQKLSKDIHIRERCVASYCLAEICRFSITELAKVRKPEFPEGVDLEIYFSKLVDKSIDLLNCNGSVLPWYVKRQIGTMLIGESVFSNIDYFKDDPFLIEVMRAARGHSVENSEIAIPAAMVAWQMCDDVGGVCKTLCEWLKLMESQAKSIAIRNIAVNNQDMFYALAECNKKDIGLFTSIGRSVGVSINNKVDELIELNGASEYLLSDVIQTSLNPFNHENALIKLALAVLKILSDEMLKPEDLLPQKILIKCNDWSSVHNFMTAEFDLKFVDSADGNDLRYSLPAWVNPETDDAALYSIGCLLRACAIGSCDFTASQIFFRQDIHKPYLGLKSTWFKRRMGMMHSPESLAGETAPMSDWITNLLFNLLQWPGQSKINIDGNEAGDLSILTLVNILQRRSEFQQDIYGLSSNMPLYVQKVKVTDGYCNSLRVITVQNLLPHSTHFTNADLELNGEVIREKHRAHLAELCRLTVKKIEAMECLNSNINAGQINLIIFPELSVHQDDVDLLKDLSAKTNSIIFAGIVFHEYQGRLINRALWLIPHKNSRGGTRWFKRWQGKFNMTKDESSISSWRPYQLLIELENTLAGIGRGYRLSGAICYDATDMRLTADLRDHSDAFLIPAFNKDVTTFDSMIDSLHYHMYQHVVLVNSGQYGGSAAKAPYRLPHHRLIAHSHGGGQIAISIFNIDLDSLLSDQGNVPDVEYSRQRKTKPAGLSRSGVN